MFLAGPHWTGLGHRMACPRPHRWLHRRSNKSGEGFIVDIRVLANNLISRREDATLIVRDLAGEPLRHIDDSFAIARNTPPEQLLPSQRAVLELSDALISDRSRRAWCAPLGAIYIS